jgi:carboxyl-terminal processing protease
MTLLPALSRPARHRFFSSALAFLLAAGAALAADRKFETLPTLRTEARQVVQLLEQVHYNRDAVHSSDYDQVIGDFMGDLDGQHLFYLNNDKNDFTSRFSKNLYWNVKNLGNIDAAYDMFNIYEVRAESRINWIFEELKKDVDLKVND